MDGWRAGITGFVVGLGGWLVLSALHIENLTVWLAALMLGIAVGVVAPRRPGIVGLLLGELASYPIALSMGTIAFLGENWLIYAVMIGAVTTAGFVAGRWIALAAAGRQVRSEPQPSVPRRP